MTHEIRRQVPWHAAFESEVAAVLEDARAVEQRDQHVWDDEEAARHHQRAVELVHHSRFAEATSEAKREFMTQLLFPDAGRWEWELFARRAALLHWWEIEPGIRARRAQKARALYEAGETQTSIAAILKLSKDRVRAALAETENQ